MEFYFADEDALVEYLKKNLKLVLDKEYGYYGEVSFDAKVLLNDTELLQDSEFATVTHYS